MTENIPPKTRGRPKTVERQRTIEQAMMSYWQEGLEACSVNEICRQAQISKPGLYREFGGEDGLMAAVLSHYRETAIAPLLTMLAAEKPAAEVLNDLIEGMTGTRETPLGCLLVKMRFSPNRLGTATLEQVALAREEMLAAYRAWYEKALAQQEVVNLDADLAAYYIETQFTTIPSLMMAGEAPERVRAQAKLAFVGLLKLRC